jgi:hypothetical protein
MAAPSFGVRSGLAASPCHGARPHGGLSARRSLCWKSAADSEADPESEAESDTESETESETDPEVRLRELTGR